MSANDIPSTHPNIVLIVIDTLRYDRVRQLASTLDGAVNYGWAVTPAPWTLPAHVSLLTGLYSSIHESHENVSMKSLLDFAMLKNTKTILPTYLKKLGYSTYGYSANSFISKAFGFDGFDILKNWEVSWAELFFRMDEVSVRKYGKFLTSRRAKDFFSFLFQLLRSTPTLFLSTLYSSIRVGLDRLFRKWPQNKGAGHAIDFVKGTKFKEPFFLFLNILEVHEPYFKNDHLIEGGFAVRELSTIELHESEHWIKGYDHQVEFLATKKLPRVFQALKDKGVFDNSLVILTSDHGQLLGEHGWIGHGVFLFDEIVQVPLIIKYPANMKVNFTRSKQPISLTAIPNFIFDIVEGRLTDSSLFGTRAFSESWTLGPKELGRRVCVYSEEGKLTYNLTNRKVEESTVKQDSGILTAKEELIESCIRFADLNDRLLARISNLGQESYEQEKEQLTQAR